MLSGCTLSHEPASPLPCAHGGACDPEVLSTCERRERPPPAPEVLGRGWAPRVATDGCDVVARAFAFHPDPSDGSRVHYRIQTSDDGGDSFSEGLVIDATQVVLAVDRAGRVHVGAVSGTDVMHHLVSSEGRLIDSRIIRRGDRPGLIRLESTVRHALALSEDGPHLAWLDEDGAWTGAPGQTPVRLSREGAPVSRPRLCAAGPRRLVAIWREGVYESLDTTDAIVRAAIRDGSGRWRTRSLGTGREPDIDCAADGRALTVWVNDQSVFTAALDQSGGWSEPTTAATLPHLADPGYPRAIVGPVDTIVAWRQHGAAAFGFVAVDSRGQPHGDFVNVGSVAEEEAPSFFHASCVSSQEIELLLWPWVRPSALPDTSFLVPVRDGRVGETLALPGPLHEIACDARGNVHAVGATARPDFMVTYLRTRR